jgi:hypothetical protein
MYILEIFLKKRKFSSIYKTAWPLLSAHVIYPPGTDDAPEQRLVFFGALSYAAVYQSSLAAGMSTSAAHYMARVFLRNFKFEEWINEAIIAIFAPADDEAQAYASGFLARVGSLMEMVRAGGDAAGPADIEPAMAELSESYRKVTFRSR